MKTVLRALLVIVVIAVAAGAFFYWNPLWVADNLVQLGLWRAGVKSEYVEAGGYRLHYFEAQPAGGGGEPLLLIHGLGARSEEWAKMIPAMAQRGFHVYAPDLPGYGRSSRPADADYSIAMEENAMVAFAKAVGLQRTFVGGWSMGGWIAAKLTLDHPEMVERLVLYDSAGLYFPAEFGADLFLPSDAAGVVNLMKVLSPHPHVLPDFAMRAVLRRIAANGWVVQRSMSSMMGGSELLDFRLQEIRSPVLLVWGAEDRLIPLIVGRRMHEEIAGSSLSVIAGCGHLAPRECWRPVVETTAEFLQENPPMRGAEKTLADQSSSALH